MSETASTGPRSYGPVAYLRCLRGIVWREALRFLHQRERFVAALVRPMVWLFIFAAGFRSILGVSIVPGQMNWVALAVVFGCAAAFLGATVFAYNPSKGLIARRGGPGTGG